MFIEGVGVETSLTWQGGNQADLGEFEASLVYIVPGQSGLERETLSKNTNSKSRDLLGYPKCRTNKMNCGQKYNHRLLASVMLI